MRSRTLSLLSFVFVALSLGSVQAQDPLDEIYGQAVHAYFRGDTNAAQELLDEVISAGSADPRPYYFRGLCQSRVSGSALVGNADFERGAQLEVEGKKIVNVGKALERVQGSVRTELERSRAKARLAARSKVLELNRARYEETKRNGIVVPPRAADGGLSPNAPTAKDPFEAENGMTRGDATPMKSQPSKKPADDPNPFGGDDAAPAGDEPMPADADNIFGN